MGRILLIGGTGTISTHTVNSLIQRGESVAVLNRGTTARLPSGVKLYQGDRNDPGTVQNVIQDFKPDAILDFVCFLPEQARNMVHAAKGNTGHYIFVSTVDVYGYPLRTLPMEEDIPFRPPVSEYAENKVLCERVFMDAHDLVSFPVTIVRPLYSLGPRFLLTTFSRDGSNVVQRIRAGKPVVVPGDGTTTIQPSLASNTGKMIAELVGQPITFGDSYNVGDDRIMTHDDYYAAIGEAIGVKPNIVHVPTELLLRVQDVANSLLFELTRFNLQYSLVKFKAHFPDYRPSNQFIEGIRSFVERVETESAGDVLQNKLEDRIVAEWGRIDVEFDAHKLQIDG